MNGAGQRLNVIHQSLVKPVLLAGAERPLAIANWITAAAIFFGGGLHWYTVTISTLLVTVGHWALVQAAKFDPQLSRVYVRHIRFQDYYAARAAISASPARVNPSVPTPREMRR